MRALKARQPTIDLRYTSELESMFKRGMSPPYDILLGYWHPPSRTIRVKGDAGLFQKLTGEARIGLQALG